MNWAHGFSWLAALTAPRGEQHAHDCAEMGTAFGLEASMDEHPAGEPEPGCRAPAPASPAEAWQRRVVRRSGL
ncbi:MAG TPA: hypothetical protein VFA35_08850 [Burkholderiaceae bacterium]|nr:hypothetical protein [Burkholderiaceae bacterium]